MMGAVEIRNATDADWDAVWPFFRRIVIAQETYAYDPAMTREQGHETWMGRPQRTVVAVDDDGTVAGSAIMGPNRAGPGAHVATASFMVDPDHGGRGIGRVLGEHVIAWAADAGYAAMQFNAVVETNTSAVRLWHALGFETIGTVPGAFRHPRYGDVGLHVMFRRL